MAQTLNKASVNRSDTYTAAASGVTVDLSLPMPMQNFALAVKGTGAAATAWDIRLEGSLDNVNFTQLIQHQAADGDGVTKFVASVPVLYVRSRCASVTLGGATNVVATLLGMQ